MRKLNLGAGKLWKRLYPDYEALDILDYGQQYVGDVFRLLREFKNESYDEVMANHFLEHFDQDDLKIIFNEVHRILVPDGLFKIQVPHMKKQKAWVLSHKTFWCEYTFEWFNRRDSDEVYGFGTWQVEQAISNRFKNIIAIMRKV